jgi:hypothetical protein
MDIFVLNLSITSRAASRNSAVDGTASLVPSRYGCSRAEFGRSVKTHCRVRTITSGAFRIEEPLVVSRSNNNHIFGSYLFIINSSWMPGTRPSSMVMHKLQVTRVQIALSILSVT